MQDIFIQKLQLKKKKATTTTLFLILAASSLLYSFLTSNLNIFWVFFSSFLPSATCKDQVEKDANCCDPKSPGPCLI